MVDKWNFFSLVGPNFLTGNQFHKNAFANFSAISLNKSCLSIQCWMVLANGILVYYKLLLFLMIYLIMFLKIVLNIHICSINVECIFMHRLKTASLHCVSIWNIKSHIQNAFPKNCNIKQQNPYVCLSAVYTRMIYDRSSSENK